MNYISLGISPEQAEKIAREHFDVKGRATPLPGYVDCNFRLEVDAGEGYILKVSRPDENEDYVHFQQELLRHIAQKETDTIAPKALNDAKGNPLTSFTDKDGRRRMVRLLTWVPGRLWSHVIPQLGALRFSLGEKCGRLTRTLQGFDHPQAYRELEWDIARSLWTRDHLDLFDQKERQILRDFQDRFARGRVEYGVLRKAVVHNDANDNNLIVSEEPVHPTVKAVIDFGDAIHTQIINDLAIACAYAIMGQNDPLDAALPVIRGYHSAFPLEERELEHLYAAIAMRLVVSVTKSALSKYEEPDNSYLRISERPAWELLQKWYTINADFALYSFRQACGFEAHPRRAAFEKWAGNKAFRISELFPTIGKDGIHPLDLSVASRWLGMQTDFDDLDLFQFKIDRLQQQHPRKIIAGGYLESRTVYTTSEYGRIGNSGPEKRTLHLGTDFWLPAGTAVHALFDGEVVTSVNDTGDKEYGGLIILKHTT
ncbi:MAG TPA: phosphotransferase, partial [Pricia sp.]|nr:phosphotransferase [Pricia sp.]